MLRIKQNLLDLNNGKGAFVIIWNDNDHTIGAICYQFPDSFLWLLCDPNGGIYRFEDGYEFYSEGLPASIEGVTGVMLMKPLPSVPVVPGHGLPKLPPGKGHLGGYGYKD